MSRIFPIELYNAATATDAPASVQATAKTAADNAEAAVGSDNRYDSENHLTREFVSAWHQAVMQILSSDPAEEVRSWFAVFGYEA